MSDETAEQELPEGFIFHRDCMVDNSDLMTEPQEDALELFIAANRRALSAVFLEDEPDLEEETIEWLIEDYAFEMVFPDLAQKKHDLEHSLALVAYEKRGLGECHDCYDEHNHNEGEEIEE